MWKENTNDTAKSPHNEIITIRAIVCGRVQGVGFRVWACCIAKRMRVTGYVKNLDDGCVELEAEGFIDRVNAFLDALVTGNGLIRVDSLHREIVSRKDYTSFEIKY